ncbi:hypothetical protein F0L17_07965 [Streptomyces sp. TRM43335]|uniref:DUF559 domain-containing protein n=1 Tax=Streptomyces taklimakanensis TaxID=2569853 RepID=A0A6G2B9V7_9ACTN|nr:hypothetical protein [Streptomyces taklimakanensis]MTE19065.1 hypothetical protein [Streptomyces taklimakanensis]
MSHEPPLSSRPVRHLSHVTRRVVTARALRDLGVPAVVADERCRPGGPWQMPLPRVYLLHPGPPTGEERLHAVLLYASRERVPAQVGARPEVRTVRPSGGPPTGGRAPRGTDAVITGPAALALRGFSSTPPLSALDHIDVLVPSARRLRSAGFARVVRTRSLPEPEEVTGLPVAPVPRALADTTARLTDAEAVRRLLTEAVRDGHCEASAVVAELGRARLLGRPAVADAVAALLAESRAVAESLLYGLVRAHGLPEPFWNVDLRLPGGPHLGGVDAYWPDQAVAVEIDIQGHGHGHGQGREAAGSARGGGAGARHARKREEFERLGVVVLHITPDRLRDHPGRQAEAVRTALETSPGRPPAAHLTVLPR